MLLELPLAEALVLVPILLLSLTIHEYAHARVSVALGDQTPREERRLTLNPLRHLDPLGALLLLVVGFGWAKPVRIDPSQYRKPNVGLVLTSIAGPLTNLLLGVVFLVLLRLAFTVPGLEFLGVGMGRTVLTMAGVVNLALFAFNMLPIPPLDGSRIVSVILKDKPRFVAAYNRFGLYVLAALLLVDRLTSGRIAVIGPVLDFVVQTVAAVVFIGL